METRSGTRGDMTESGGSARAKKSFTINAVKVWNKASQNIRTAKSLAMAKTGNQSPLQKFTYLEIFVKL